MEYVHEYTRASDGKKYHRCSVCWPWVNTDNNGYVPATEPIKHAKNCPVKGKK